MKKIKKMLALTLVFSAISVQSAFALNRDTVLYRITKTYKNYTLKRTDKAYKNLNFKNGYYYTTSHWSENLGDDGDYKSITQYNYVTY